MASESSHSCRELDLRPPVRDPGESAESEPDRRQEDVEDQDRAAQDRKPKRHTRSLRERPSFIHHAWIEGPQPGARFPHVSYGRRFGLALLDEADDAGGGL